MIPKDYITEWKQYSPWLFDSQVEQDLLISRALVELFSQEDIANSLAFRGGTALYKLFLTPAPRYSEDIDLVQIKAEPIGTVLSKLRDVLDPLLGEPKRKFGNGRVTVTYRFKSEEDASMPLRLKVEINTREHFSVLGFTKQKFAVNSSWFQGEVDIPTYQLEELMGTKLRALFQRCKGRDLFDLWYAFQKGNLDAQKVVNIFYHYLEKQNLAVTRAQFEKNFSEKARTPLYIEDIQPLLASEVKNRWNLSEAIEVMDTKIFPLLKGSPWKGE